MIVHTPAKIYKAQQRSLNETNTHKVYSTQNEMIVCNDETLAPQHSVTRIWRNTTSTLLIPLVGKLDYVANTKKTLVPGDVAVLPGNSTITLINPYKAELINYLSITASDIITDQPMTATVNFNLRNILHSFIEEKNIKGCIGIFDGRNETTYSPSSASSTLFVFVINGAFEAEGRLLESRDALALTGIKKVEIEALSPDAIILMLELTK
ncbi:hypothetical protein GR160_12020 [Flavobacterium sp. Sd200]|uniref:pirin family protein n=1 Tax=Flavobacterium sp. Sd200 TaxID=2692211 RepID=UPI00136950D3|nr:hypothetical protein [Flavobacterium sp. Sd200]MXN91951.1 hypothetical protein [Flavobacterium sp. Sd200]